MSYVLTLDFLRPDIYEGGPRISVHDTLDDLLTEIATELRSEIPRLAPDLAAGVEALLHGGNVVAAADRFFSQIGGGWSAYHPLIGYRSALFADATARPTPL